MQHELSKAVSGPLAAKQRAAAQVVTTAEETLQQARENAQRDKTVPQRRRPGRPPKATPCLEQATQAVEAAQHSYQHLCQVREQIGQSIRALGHVYHFVDVERGVRRNGKLIASDLQAQLDTIRALAQQEGLSQGCLDRIEKAERVIPKMRATIEFVSGYVRQQVNLLGLAQPASYAMHAHLIPSDYLERVASTKTITEGKPLRELADRLRAPLFATGGVCSGRNLAEQDQLKRKAATLADVFQRSSSNVEGRNGSLFAKPRAARTRPSQEAGLFNSRAQ